METERKIEDLKEEHFRPKWILNGFPKSGLHWLALMMLPIAKPLNDDHEIWNVPWAGTFRGNSWTGQRVPLPRATYKIGRLTDGHYLKTHLGHTPELDSFLWHLGACHVFIFRDPRDVAVSQAYHVLSEDDDRLAHPDKDLYRALGGFGEILRAVIAGLDKYPGVMARWEDYAPWLESNWTMKVRFETLKADPLETARLILRYGTERVSGIFGLSPVLNEPGIEEAARYMVQCGDKTEASPTFRKGAVGDWRDHFTPELCELFRETDQNDWMGRLGYGW